MILKPVNPNSRPKFLNYRGILNVHASLLPKWRGASPIAHSIIYGDSTTGVSIMKIAPHKYAVYGTEKYYFKSTVNNFKQ